MIKTILFDFDGTLVDSAPGIVKTMQQTFRRMGVAVPDEDAMRATIGLPLDKALQMLAGLSDDDTRTATKTYRDIFHTYEVNYINNFPHVISTLNKIPFFIFSAPSSESKNLFCKYLVIAYPPFYASLIFLI